MIASLLLGCLSVAAPAPPVTTDGPAPAADPPAPTTGVPAPATDVPAPAAPDRAAPWRSGAAAWLQRGLAASDYHTGSPLFDQEWLYGTAMMAAVGFGQHALTHPADHAEDLHHLAAAVDRLLAEDARAFDTRSWGEDPIHSLSTDRGHAAWLGYTGVALGIQRLADPDFPHVALHDAVVDAIERRIAAAPGHLVETYPGEIYPVDNAAMVGALGLHTRATGARHPMVDAWVATTRARWLEDGLLVQSVRDGRAADHPRGSGTFLAAWFLHHADPVFAEALYVAGRDRLAGEVFAVYGMREYPRGVNGRGDIDSGPIVLGFGVSATGFALGAALQNGDVDTADRLIHTATTMADLVLAIDPSLRGPSDAGSASGSHIGDAILFAMASSGV